MASPLSFFRLAAPLCLALAAGVAATAPAAAQYVGPWGGAWGGPFGPPPSRLFGPPPETFDQGRISPRVVAGILRAHGYRLVAAPRISGDDIIAIGETADGRRARFVIDSYDGDLLAMRHAGPGGPALGRNVPPADLALGAPVDIDGGRPDNGRMDNGRMDTGGLPDPLIDRLPNAQKPHKAAPRVKTVNRAPLDHRGQAERRKVAPVAPSQATGVPKAPIPQPAPVQAAPAQAAPAPAQATVAPATPLAPDAQPQARPDAKPDAAQTGAGPADIGPRVQPAPVQARAPITPPAEPAARAPDATPPDPAPAPVSPPAPAAAAPEPTP